MTIRLVCRNLYRLVINNVHGQSHGNREPNRIISLLVVLFPTRFEDSTVDTNILTGIVVSKPVVIHATVTASCRMESAVIEVENFDHCPCALIQCASFYPSCEVEHEMNLNCSV